MSHHYQDTPHPITGKTEQALHMNDYFGPHRYGVWFPSDNSTWREMPDGSLARDESKERGDG